MDRLSQNTTETAIMTGGMGRKKTTIREAAPSRAHRRQVPRAARPEATSEDAQQVGHERGGTKRRQADRLEAAPSGDRRQEARDHGHRDADADGRDQVEREIAADSALSCARADG